MASAEEGGIALEGEFQLRLEELRSRGGPARLTPRESSVLAMVAEGMSNKEVAGRLEISETAAKRTLQRLFAKTGVRSRSALVRFVIDKGLEKRSI